MHARTLVAWAAFAGLTAAANGDEYVLLTGVSAGNYPAVARAVVPIPGPGFPGTFNDGDRLAGTADDGPPIVFQGIGTPLFKPNEFGALSFIFRRGSVPVGGPNLVPFMGIEFLGGPRLDLDGDPAPPRSLVPASGKTPVPVGGLPSFFELDLDPAMGLVELRALDLTGTNEGAPGISANTATVLLVLAGTSTAGDAGAAINPSIDTRVGTLTPFLGAGGTLERTHRIDELGFELWLDSIDPGSSTASTLGTFQQLGELRGWAVRRDDRFPPGGSVAPFPKLAGQGLGGTLWPKVDASQVGQTFLTANGLAGGSATIAGGIGGDAFTAPNNGGLALTDFGGDLGVYLDQVVVPLVPPWAYRFVYLEAAGFGINNSFDPVFQDTIGYDVVLVAFARCPGDCDGDGVVTQADLGVLLAFYGKSVSETPEAESADLDADGVIGQSDLGILLAAYGKTCD